MLWISHTFDPDKLSYVYKAVSNIKSALPKNIPLIGFSGSPWTLAAYSIEGRSSKSFEFTKNFIKHNEKEAHIFLAETNRCLLYLLKKTS
jgi:uroporphyrinogen decarboxylase